MRPVNFLGGAHLYNIFGRYNTLRVEKRKGCNKSRRHCDKTKKKNISIKSSLKKKKKAERDQVSIQAQKKVDGLSMDTLFLKSVE